jgi:hypothetical protein
MNRTGATPVQVTVSRTCTAYDGPSPLPDGPCHSKVLCVVFERLRCSDYQPRVPWGACHRTRCEGAREHPAKYRIHSRPANRSLAWVSLDSEVASSGMANGDFVRERLRSVLRTGRFLPNAAAPEASRREPYVQGVTATSAVICWVGEEPAVGRSLTPRPAAQDF